MDQVTVDQGFWDLFPDAQVNILYADGINNHDNDENVTERRQLLHNATKEAQKVFDERNFPFESSD